MKIPALSDGATKGRAGVRGFHARQGGNVVSDGADDSLYNRMMSGERDLKTLLQDMKPEMQTGVFVFCTLTEGKDIPAAVKPLLIFREQEGTTCVMRREEAENAGLPFEFASRLITLKVHSALDAVGFLAATAVRLAEAGISVNVVSAFYHDHFFVPDDRAEEALRILHRP